MILTHKKLLEEIKNGDIKIEPFSEDQVGAGSIDLHLGSIFRVFRQYGEPIIVDNKADARNISKLVEVKDEGTITLEPGQTVLGVTKEKITLAPDIAGWLEGRSRFARMGLGVHITSGFIQPGTEGLQVLEITNLSPNHLILKPGLRICQIVFEKCSGKARYKGKFKGQRSP